MKNLRAKSPCCRKGVIRFGSRRRQCVLCRSTWRIRQKKSGRKSKRESENLVKEYLQNIISSSSGLAKAKGISKDRILARLKRSRELFLRKTPWPKIPEQGDLIAVADAMVLRIEKRWHTIYFIVLRPINDIDAVILPPHLGNNTESIQGWREAFDKLPKTVFVRIKAIVCDGHRGLTLASLKNFWILQRCHFHLIARIQSRRSKWKSSRHYDEGRRIYELVREILSVKDKSGIQRLLDELKELCFFTSSNELKSVIRGFLMHSDNYRSYINYPELNLPATNNAAESLIGMVQELRHRAKGFRTIFSFLRWTETLIKFKKTIKCRAKKQPN